MIFSLSEIANAKRCDRKWMLGSTNCERLTPKMHGLALDLGKAVHAALAEWRTNPGIDPVNEYLVVMNDLALEAEQAYRDVVGVTAAESERENIYNNTRLGQAMVENYKRHWRTPIEAGWSQVAGAETEFLVSIPGTEHQLKGFWDDVLVGPHNQLFVLDSKSYDKRPKLENLTTREQFVGYTWALQQVHPQEQVAGIAYDGLWKRAEPPEKPKGMTIADLFCRITIKPSREEIAEFERELAITTNRMADLHDRIYNVGIYDEPRLDQAVKSRRDTCSWDCSDFGSEAGGRISLCRAMSRDEDTDSIRAARYIQRPIDPNRGAEQRATSEADD